MSSTNNLGKPHTKIIKSSDKTVVKYYTTNVVEFNENEIVLNSNGWRTSTTKNRINKAANQFKLLIQVFQKDYSWFVSLPSGETIPFEDNMVIGRTV